MISRVRRSNHRIFQALHALFPEKNSLDEYRTWYRDSVIQKIKERSWKYEGVPGTYIDIVNVINATSVHWAADRMVRFSLLQFIFASESNCQFFQCGLPLKTKENPSGIYTEQEIYDMFATLVSIEFGRMVRWDD